MSPNAGREVAGSQPMSAVPGLLSLKVFQCTSHCSLFYLYFPNTFKLKTEGRIGRDLGRCPPWFRRVRRRQDPSRPSSRSGCSAPGRTSEKPASRDDRFETNRGILSIVNFEYSGKTAFFVFKRVLEWGNDSGQMWDDFVERCTKFYSFTRRRKSDYDQRILKSR